MDIKDLKALKLTEDFIISPTKFLLMFEINCGRLNHININKLSRLSNNKVTEASNHLVNLENVLKGDIFLVGTPRKFKPFHRPVTQKVADIIIRDKQKMKKKTLSFYNLSRLFQCFSETEDDDIINMCLDEIYDRSYNSIQEELEPTYQKVISPKRKGA